jgi:hypothetical protein
VLKNIIGKNKQEDVRLQLIQNVIEKDFDYEENNRLKEINEIKTVLEDIKVSTSTHFSESNFDNDSEISFDSLSFNNRTVSSIKNYQVSSKSAASNRTHTSLFSRILNSAYDQSEPDEFTGRDDGSSTRRRPKSYSIIKFRDASCRLSADFFRDPMQKVKTNSKNNEAEDSDFDYQDNGEFMRYARSEKRNLLSHQSNINEKCSLFPCDLLKSYTSMCGPKKDRNQHELKSLCLKRVLDEKLIKIQNELNMKNFKKKNVEFKQNERQLEEQNLVINKSIRRPLRRSHSGREILHKVSSLKIKADYCRRENEINFRRDDRNVRYGMYPPPKSKISRQMRILSKFESILK